MSSFTINGKPAGYFIEVIRSHREQCAKAVAAGVLTPQQAEEFARDAIESGSELSREKL